MKKYSCIFIHNYLFVLYKILKIKKFSNNLKSDLDFLIKFYCRDDDHLLVYEYENFNLYFHVNLCRPLLSQRKWG